MALNLDKMRQKLDTLNGKGDKKNNAFWRPSEGENNIRILPTPDGDPFKEKFFHYGVGNQSFLCPKRNFGDECPVCSFASQLWDEGTEDSKKMANGKAPGASFPTTDIRPRPRKSVLCDDAIGGDERCAELLETVPDIDTVFERKTTEEVQVLLDQHLSGETGNNEVEKYGGTNTTTTTTATTEASAVEQAFNELLS